jgi:uncharacterized protein (TIGR02679 family)
MTGMQRAYSEMLEGRHAMVHDRQRLDQCLGKPDMARLVQRIKNRLRFGRDLNGTLSLPSPTASERSAIDAFLGRRPTSGEDIVVRLSEIERILLEGGICNSLQEAIEAIVGPVENERQARLLLAREWEDVFTKAAAKLTDLPQGAQWLEHLRSTGLLKRLSDGDAKLGAKLLEFAVAVIRQLPQPVIPIAEFATRVTGDSHALDAGTVLSTICLAAIAHQYNVKEPRSAESRRKLWDRVGIVVDELCAPVLTLNLPGTADSCVGKLLNLMRSAGEPCHLSVRQLRRVNEDAFGNLAGMVVYVCENPSVVAAAAQRLGKRSHPLICTSGQPASAAQLLIRQLSDAGCRMCYHGDFDAAGISIANLMIGRFGVLPWRMSAGDYIAVADLNGPGLKAAPPDAIWDATLFDAMRSNGHAVLEERVLESLLDDLRFEDDGC